MSSNLENTNNMKNNMETQTLTENDIFIIFYNKNK